MPPAPRRRDDIVAAVAAYDRTHPSAPLPRNAARLLVVMFPSEDVCQRSQKSLAAEGFGRDTAYFDVAAPRRGRIPFATPGGPECPTPIGCTCRRRSTHDDPAFPPVAAPARLRPAADLRAIPGLGRQHDRPCPLQPPCPRRRRSSSGTVPASSTGRATSLAGMGAPSAVPRWLCCTRWSSTSRTSAPGGWTRPTRPSPTRPGCPSVPSPTP